MVASLVFLLGRIAAIDIHPAPASKLLVLIMQPEQTSHAAQRENRVISGSFASGERGRTLSAAECKAAEDMEKLGPVLQSLLGLLAESEYSVDAAVVFSQPRT